MQHPNVQFSWPYSEDIYGSPGVAWYPANLRGISFDLQAGRTNTQGGWTGSKNEQTTFPGLASLGIPEFTWAVIIPDIDAIAFIGGQESPMYLAGGYPAVVNMRGVKAFVVKPSQEDEKSTVISLSHNFGLMVHFTNHELPPVFPAPYPAWFQRSNANGALKSIAKVNAAGTADSWHMPVVAPVFTDTPTGQANSYTITAANLFSPVSFTHGIRTSHLSHLHLSVRVEDGPAVFRVQGVLPKGADFIANIVDDPLTGAGVLIPEDGRFDGVITRQYAIMRFLFTQPAYVAVDNAVEIGLELAGRPFGGN